MPNIVTNRFILAVKQLIKENKIRSIRQFCQTIDYLPQSMSQVMHGQRDVTIDVIRSAVDQFKLNPNFLFMGEGSPFIEEKDSYSFKAITVVTDRENNERIVHVPAPAMAGYAADLNGVEMIRDLPTYTLPDITYQTGTYRSFDVKGDSMSPTIEEGDVLVCSYIEPTYWVHSIRNHHVYVLVTRGDVVVKRVINNLERHKHLELHSDNESFNMYRLSGNELKEVWFVRAKLSRFKHNPSQVISQSVLEEMQSYKQMVQAQSDMINLLQKQLHTNGK